MTSHPNPGPINVEAEAALLGALMMDARWIDPVADIVTAEDFHEALHGRIFTAILAEAAKGTVPNAITLQPYFVDDPAMRSLARHGEAPCAYLVKLTANSAALLGVRDFALQVADLAKRRRLISGMQDAIVAATDCTEPVEEVVSAIDASLQSSLTKVTTARSVSFAAAWDATLAQIDDEAAGISSPGIEIDGLSDWNRLVGKMRPGDVIILAARPSMGKTATALELTIGAARAGHGALFISLEMTVDQLLRRTMANLMFSASGGPNLKQISAGSLNASERQQMRDIRSAIAEWPLQLFDPSEMRIGRLGMTIRRYARQMRAKGADLKLVVIDYLGLIKGNGRRQSRYEDVSEISRTVKAVAKECGVTIVMLAQLNRAVEQREDKRPQLSDLRDSGDIEQDADVVMFLYRAEYYLERSEPPVDDKRHPGWLTEMQAARNRLQLLTAKARNGRIGSREVWYFTDHQAVRPSDFYRQQEMAA